MISVDGRENSGRLVSGGRVCVVGERGFKGCEGEGAAVTTGDGWTAGVGYPRAMA